MICYLSFILYQIQILEYYQQIGFIEFYSMDCFQNKAEIKREQFKSIFRLIPINQQSRIGLIKQKQIDEVRKQLKVISIINQNKSTHQNDCEQLTSFYVRNANRFSGALLGLRNLKLQPDNHRRLLCTGISDTQNLCGKVRKTKTESEENIFSNATLKRAEQSNKQCLCIGSTQILQKSSNNSEVKISSPTRQRKIIINFQVSQQLKNLKKDHLNWMNISENKFGQNDFVRGQKINKQEAKNLFKNERDLLKDLKISKDQKSTTSSIRQAQQTSLTSSPLQPIQNQLPHDNKVTEPLKGPKNLLQFRTKKSKNNREEDIPSPNIKYSDFLDFLTLTNSDLDSECQKAKNCSQILKDKINNNFTLNEILQQTTIKQNAFRNMSQNVSASNSSKKVKEKSRNGESQTITYKFYIVKGNNQQLPRKLLRKRKWVETNRIEQANLVWSQRRQEKYYKYMQKIYASNRQKTKRIYNFQYLCICNQDPCRCSYSKLLEISRSIHQNEKTKQNVIGKNIRCEKRKKNINTYYKISFQQSSLFPHISNIDFRNSRIENTPVEISQQRIRIHNHLFNNHEVAFKKLLFQNLFQYYTISNKDPFQYIPMTFHIQSLNCVNWSQFIESYNLIYEHSQKQNKKKSLWIIKPGENTNRGHGIKVQKELSQIQAYTQQILSQNSTAIVQLYIMPLLYNKRKFDIRCYVLVTIINNHFKAYWYEEGYIRTSSKLFDPENIDNRFIHLTNDAVQKNGTNYGKFEPGNKLSFEQLSGYIQSNFLGQHFKAVQEQMENLAYDVFQSTYGKLHNLNKNYCFEIFGLDFLIDESLKVWLIQVNRNPCLETSTSLLSRVIGEMLENAFKIGVDQILPPAILEQQMGQNGALKNIRIENKYKLILDRKLNSEL